MEQPAQPEIGEVKGASKGESASTIVARAQSYLRLQDSRGRLGGPRCR